jgi:hypothetical protein
MYCMYIHGGACAMTITPPPHSSKLPEQLRDNSIIGFIVLQPLIAAANSSWEGGGASVFKKMCSYDIKERLKQQYSGKNLQLVEVKRLTKNG